MKGPTTGAFVGAFVGAKVGCAEGGLVSPTLVGLGVGLNVGSAVGALAPSVNILVSLFTALDDPDPPGETRALIVTLPAPAAGIVNAPTPTKEHKHHRYEFHTESGSQICTRTYG